MRRKLVAKSNASTGRWTHYSRLNYVKVIIAKTARVNAALKERELQASGMEMLRIKATNCLWLPHEAMEDLLLQVGQIVRTAYAMEGDVLSNATG
jgi:hypothetical protein